jgi:hypothetical protein
VEAVEVIAVDARALGIKRNGRIGDLRQRLAAIAAEVEPGVQIERQRLVELGPA